MVKVLMGEQQFVRVFSSDHRNTLNQQWHKSASKLRPEKERITQRIEDTNTACCLRPAPWTFHPTCVLLMFSCHVLVVTVVSPFYSFLSKKLSHPDCVGGWRFYF